MHVGFPVTEIGQTTLNKEKLSLLEGFSFALSPALSWLHFPCVDSTNTYLLDKDQPCQQLVSADAQTHGRGRRSQNWIDEGESALFSISTPFPAKLDIGPWPVQVAITLAESLNVLLEHAGDDSRVKIKWPNDLYFSIDGHWGKFGGILVETTIGKTGKVVSGIGLNLAPIHQQVNPDYLSAYLPSPLPKKALIAVLANRLLADWKQFLNCPAVSASAYHELDYLAGVDLVAIDLYSGEKKYGKGAGINTRGELLLQCSTKKIALTTQHRIRFAK